MIARFVGYRMGHVRSLSAYCRMTPAPVRGITNDASPILGLQNEFSPGSSARM